MAPILGSQTPTFSSIPDYVDSRGQEAIEVCAAVGLDLDPWQRDLLTGALGRRADGRWSSPEVGLAQPRRDGKRTVLCARELFGLFCAGERLLIHSAHMFVTSLESFRMLLWRIEDSDLERQIKRVSKAHGEEGIELKTGQRIQFRTRTRGGGRGFSADCILVDESQILSEASHASMLPTISARPYSQVWMCGTAGGRSARSRRPASFSPGRVSAGTRMIR